MSKRFHEMPLEEARAVLAIINQQRVDRWFNHQLNRWKIDIYEHRSDAQQKSAPRFLRTRALAVMGG